jgi:hypothetical protein
MGEGSGMGVTAELDAARGIDRRSHPHPCPSPIQGEGTWFSILAPCGCEWMKGTRSAGQRPEDE